MSDINVPDEIAPAQTPFRLSEWLSRMFRYVREGLKSIYAWQVDHLRLTPPLYLEDPHPIYWHVIRDSAAAHMHFEDFGTGKPVTDGSIVTNYDSDIITPWQTVTDLAAGTITMPQTTDGVYTVMLNIYVTGGAQNQTYVFTVYVDGVASSLHMPIILTGNVNTGEAAYSGVVSLPSGTVLDVRMNHGSGGTCNVNFISWSVVRYLSAGGVDGAAALAKPIHTSPPPIGYGQPP